MGGTDAWRLCRAFVAAFPCDPRQLCLRVGLLHVFRLTLGFYALWVGWSLDFSGSWGISDSFLIQELGCSRSCFRVRGVCAAAGWR